METIDEIVREMRIIGSVEEKSTDQILSSFQSPGLRMFAARIEAAAKRERAATSEKSSVVGNASAMRKALSDACYAMLNFLKTQNGGYEEMANALDKAKAALAKPPRNCDKYNTADEAYAGFREFCDKSVCSECRCDQNTTTCRLSWLFAEAEVEVK